MASSELMAATMPSLNWRRRNKLHVEQRIGPAQRAPHEHAQRRDGDRQHDERGTGQRRLVLGEALDRPDQRHHARDRKARAQVVPAPRVRDLRFGEHQEPGDQHDHHDRHIHQQRRAPRERLQQYASYDGVEGGAGDLRAFGGVGEDHPQHRQCGGHDHRAADTQQGAQRDHLGRGVGPQNQQRGDPEVRIAQQQHACAAEAVAASWSRRAGPPAPASTIATTASTISRRRPVQVPCAT